MGSRRTCGSPRLWSELQLVLSECVARGTFCRRLFFTTFHMTGLANVYLKQTVTNSRLPPQTNVRDKSTSAGSRIVCTCVYVRFGAWMDVLVFAGFYSSTQQVADRDKVLKPDLAWMSGWRCRVSTRSPELLPYWCGVFVRGRAGLLPDEALKSSGVNRRHLFFFQAQSERDNPGMHSTLQSILYTTYAQRGRRTPRFHTVRVCFVGKKSRDLISPPPAGKGQPRGHAVAVGSVLGRAPGPALDRTAVRGEGHEPVEHL